MCLLSLSVKPHLEAGQTRAENIKKVETEKRRYRNLRTVILSGQNQNVQIKRNIKKRRQRSMKRQTGQQSEKMRSSLRVNIVGQLLNIKRKRRSEKRHLL